MSTLAAFEGLTDKQAEFVRLLSKGFDSQVALQQAGYANTMRSSTILQSPAVRAALFAAVQRELQDDAGANLAVLRKIRDDDKAPARVRADIGVKLLQMAGHVVPSGKGAEQHDKPLSQMSQGELLEFINRNQRAIDEAEQTLANQAKDVTPSAGVSNSVPATPDTQANTLNYLD